MNLELIGWVGFGGICLMAGIGCGYLVGKKAMEQEVGQLRYQLLDAMRARMSDSAANRETVRDLLGQQTAIVEAVAAATVEAATAQFKITPQDPAPSGNLEEGNPWGPVDIGDPTDGMIPDDLLVQAGLLPDLRVVPDDPELDV